MRSRDCQRTLTYQGVTRSLSEWRDITGVKLSKLHNRCDAGWPPAQILGYELRPGARQRKMISYNGRRMPPAWWASFLGIPRTTLQSRIRSGYPTAQVLGYEPLEKKKVAPRAFYARSDGECHTMGEWEKILGRKESTLRARLRRGWTLDQTLELDPPPRPFSGHKPPQQPPPAPD